MAPDFSTLLATEIINEQKTLSYRNISRALKVHVNAAKCMLYEFHQRENKKRPGSVYATYLISGVKKSSSITVTTKENAPVPKGSDLPVKIDGDEDTEMGVPSSPPPFPSSMPSVSFAASQKVEQAALPERLQVPIRTVSLVREEDLDKVRAQYDKITSIHVYSLSPGRVPDLQVLTDTNRALFSDVFVKEDPLIHNKNYGVIQNPNVRRRSGKRPANIEMPVPKAQPTSITTAKPAAQVKQISTKDEPSRPSSRDSTSTQDSKSGKPNLKRDGSNLFKAFAKQTTKPRLDRKDTNASAASGSGAEADTKMLENEDEGESEDEALFLDTKTRKEGKKRSSDVTKEREERQAKLRKMMEDDEAEAKAVPSVDDASGLKSAPPAEKIDEDGDGDVAWSESDSEAKAKKGHTEQEPSQPTRRRGRRKVMKKKQTKDEDGYLVTREEEVWESFSEDEASKPQPKPKPAPPKSQPKSSAASTAKSGAAPAKKKGDIMSFFGKK